MEAQVWTLIGLLGATLLGLLGSIFYMGQRIDGLGSRIDAGFDATDARFDRVDVRMDGLATRLDDLSSVVQEQGRTLGDRIYEFGVKLDDHSRRHAG